MNRSFRILVAAVTAATVAVAAPSSSAQSDLVLDQVLTDSAGATGQYGTSVSTSGEVRQNKLILVGNAAVNNSRGAADLWDYSVTGWTLTRRFTASDGGTGDGYGRAVSAFRGPGLGGTQDAIAIGAPNAANRSGAVYVYRLEGTWREYKITPSDPEYAASFGISVALDFPVLVVGAPGKSDKSGAVYVFRWNETTDTWIQKQKLSASDAETWDWFGWSVAFDGHDGQFSRIAVGAPLCDDSIYGDDVGAVYTYRKVGTDWTDERILQAPASRREPNAQFGSAVAVYREMIGDAILTGAPGENSFTGAAYALRSEILDPNRFYLEERLAPSSLDSGDYFGRAVAMNGSVALVGAHNYGAGAGGAAFVFWHEAPRTVTGPKRRPSSTVPLASATARGQPSRSLNPGRFRRWSQPSRPGVPRSAKARSPSTFPVTACVCGSSPRSRRRSPATSSSSA